MRTGRHPNTPEEMPHMSKDTVPPEEIRASLEALNGYLERKAKAPSQELQAKQARLLKILRQRQERK